MIPGVEQTMDQYSYMMLRFGFRVLRQVALMTCVVGLARVLRAQEDVAQPPASIDETDQAVIETASKAGNKISFNRDIRPILSDHCFACHGFDAKNRQADLRLDTPAGALSETSGSPAIVPGQLEESPLWLRINESDAALRMPPPESHKELTAAQIELIKRWIEAGASYQKHWALERPVVVPVPSVLPDSGNPIDAFLLVRLQEHGLTMLAEADRRTLIRRVAFAVTGLPPTPADVETYLLDRSPAAYERMVDRYLASPHYGEEMARHWLDLVRYGDTHGLHLDNERQMWSYRDWVVDSFNRNLPYDQFTIDQLAGDLVTNPTMEQLIATGYNRCNVTSSEGGSIDAELLYRYAVDRASTTMSSWMGLTGGCAVCHDHKFDPISQKEFYSMYAFFNSAADPAMDGNALLTDPIMKLERPEHRLKLADWDQQIAARQQALDSLALQVVYADPAEAASRPAEVSLETVWMDDEFPPSGQLQASPGAPTKFVSAEGGEPVFSGQSSLQRIDTGLAQDVWEHAQTPLPIPIQGQIFAYVWLDPSDSPKSIMLQFYKDGWNHRAVWGDYQAIDWGAINTTERVLMGPLPAAGMWVRLEVPIQSVGLTAGDSLTGFALTQFGGKLNWDKVGVQGIANPVSDPAQSFQAWRQQAIGKDTPGLATELNALLKMGPGSPLPPADLDRLRAYYLQSVCVETTPQFAEPIAELKKLQSERQAFFDAIPSTFVYRDLPQPRESFIMLRGQYDQPGEKVEPNVPEVLPPLTKANPAGMATRLDLARWLFTPEHPLTARVAVNRFWQQFFGTGLVKTSGDFGSQGDAPSHPELLDWLALNFQEGNWDVKQLVRLLVTSAAFRQDVHVNSEVYSLDPENRWYARGPRLRLDAEQIRDNALFVSGLMRLQMGGPGVKPYQPANVWEPVGFAGSNTRNYQQDKGDALYRRSLYAFYKRTAPPPFMMNFDAPNREQSCTRRERSNTPLQALQLMNDVQHVEAARTLAQRMLVSGGVDARNRIAFAYQLVLTREPADEEIQIIEQQLQSHLERYRQSPAEAEKLVALGESQRLQTLDPAELAAYTLVANLILNLDETLNRN